MTIRLLDPPLHEFLPAPEEATTSEMRRVSPSSARRTRCSGPAAAGWASVPERSTRCRCVRSCARPGRWRSGAGEAPLVEIMHPLVGFGEELHRLRELTERVAAEEPSVAYLCGTMIELPRACIRTDEIAGLADFFSFGTNDLTQTALGFSRDDAEGKFLTFYLEHGVLERNRSETLDREGVGDLMQIAVERGRGVKPDLKLGICGEHGGEPRSVAFCHQLGLDYVNCSPYRVPLARLAAAQAARRAGWSRSPSGLKPRERRGAPSPGLLVCALRRHRTSRTVLDALCRRVPRRSATVSRESRRFVPTPAMSYSPRTASSSRSRRS